MPNLLWQAGFALVGWKPAKEQLREMLEKMGLKVNGVFDFPISFGGSRLAAYIETPSLNISDLIASLENHRAGVNISVTFYSGTPDEAPPPLPAPLWWESLTVTDPRTEIYSARAAAQVYYSDGPNHAPSFDQRALINGELWTLPFGKSVEVWRIPVAGSGWICVHTTTTRALWVRAEDMRATP